MRPIKNSLTQDISFQNLSAPVGSCQQSSPRYLKGLICSFEHQSQEFVTLNLPMAKARGSENLFQCSLRPLASATTSAASHWIIFFLNGRSALRDIALKGCRSIPHARRFSFVPASPVLRERFRTRCEQRIKTKATQNGNPRLKSPGLCPFAQLPNSRPSTWPEIFLRFCSALDPSDTLSTSHTPSGCFSIFRNGSGDKYLSWQLPTFLVTRPLSAALPRRLNAHQKSFLQPKT
jgi:hypothetical protein